MNLNVMILVASILILGSFIMTALYASEKGKNEKDLNNNNNNNNNNSSSSSYDNNNNKYESNDNNETSVGEIILKENAADKKHAEFKENVNKLINEYNNKIKDIAERLSDPYVFFKKYNWNSIVNCHKDYQIPLSILTKLKMMTEELYMKLYSLHGNEENKKDEMERKITDAKNEISKIIETIKDTNDDISKNEYYLKLDSFEQIINELKNNFDISIYEENMDYIYNEMRRVYLLALAYTVLFYTKFEREGAHEIFEIYEYIRDDPRDFQAYNHSFTRGLEHEYRRNSFDEYKDLYRRFVR